MLVLTLDKNSIRFIFVFMHRTFRQIFIGFDEQKKPSIHLIISQVMMIEGYALHSLPHPKGSNSFAPLQQTSTMIRKVLLLLD